MTELNIKNVKIWKQNTDITVLKVTCTSIKDLKDGIYRNDTFPYTIQLIPKPEK